LEADTDTDTEAEGDTEDDGLTEELGDAEEEGLTLVEALGEADEDGLTLGEALADGETLELGLVELEGETEELGLRDTLELAEGLTDEDGDTDELGLSERDTEADGDTEELGDTEALGDIEVDELGDTEALGEADELGEREWEAADTISGAVPNQSTPGLGEGCPSSTRKILSATARALVGRRDLSKRVITPRFQLSNVRTLGLGSLLGSFRFKSRGITFPRRFHCGQPLSRAQPSYRSRYPFSCFLGLLRRLSGRSDSQSSCERLGIYWIACVVLGTLN
jgi:hypothetical protein